MQFFPYVGGSDRSPGGPYRRAIQEGHTNGPYKWAPDQWARGKGQDHESQTVCNRSSSSGQPLLSQSTSQLVN